MGIAHTRWATCGGKVSHNAHPHFDDTSRFHIVHNGIISNHNEIKEKYLDDVKFTSETDNCEWSSTKIPIDCWKIVTVGCHDHRQQKPWHHLHLNYGIPYSHWIQLSRGPNFRCFIKNSLPMVCRDVLSYQWWIDPWIGCNQNTWAQRKIQRQAHQDW